MSRLLALTISAALVLASAPAMAAGPPPAPVGTPSEADVERAAELYENGRALFLDGSYDAAISGFERAYALSGDASLLYNIALAHDRAGRYDDAIAHLEYYRAFAPASERDALGEKIDGLRRRKVRSQSDEPTDPQPKESTPEPRRQGATDAPEVKIFTTPAIALAAVAGVGYGVGIALGVLSLRKKQDVTDACSAGSSVCPAGASSDIGASKNFALGADIGLAVGVAATLGVIVVVALNARKRKSSRTAFQGQWTPLVTRSAGGISFRF